MHDPFKCVRAKEAISNLALHIEVGSVSESGSAFMRVTANINLFDPDTDPDPDVDGIVFSDAYVRLI